MKWLLEQPYRYQVKNLICLTESGNPEHYRNFMLTQKCPTEVKAEDEKSVEDEVIPRTRPEVDSKPNGNSNTGDTVEYCVTKKCLKQGLEMNNYMNRTVDPCDSFYDFACNGWENNHLLEHLVQMLSNGGSEYDNFVKVQMKIGENFEKLLTSDDTTVVEATTVVSGLNPDSVDDDSATKGKNPLTILPVQNTKSMYAQCVNAPREVNYPALNLVLNDIGGWPLVSKKFDQQNYRWEDYFETVVNRYTDNIFIEIDTTVNENVTKHLMLSTWQCFALKVN